MISYKKYYLAYFYSYFIANVIFIYVNLFLPVYFFNVLNVNRAELAFIQIFAYSALFIKPVIAIYLDKKKSIKQLTIILSSFSLFISYVLFIFNLNLLIVFGTFLGINFAFISVIDVFIDKIIVNFSPDEKIKDRSALATQLGSIAGAIFPNIVFILIFKDIYSIPTWNLFFLIGAMAIFPIVFIGFLIRGTTGKFENIINDEENEINKKSVILLCIILFISYSHRIYEYPLEPWILNKFGEEYFSLFLLFLIIIIIINAFGVILAASVSNRFSRKKLLILSTFIIGVLLIIAPFTDMITFFILFGIMQIFSGFIIINLIALMISNSHKKVVYYQIMAACAILATVVFVPLGTYLSEIIATEIIIVIAGILRLIAVIPILLLDD